MTVADDIRNRSLSRGVGSLRWGAGAGNRASSVVDSVEGELYRRARRSTPGHFNRVVAPRDVADKIGASLDKELADFAKQRQEQVLADLRELTGLKINAPRADASAEFLGGSAKSWLEPAGQTATTAVRATAQTTENLKQADFTAPMDRLRQNVKAVARSGAMAAHNAAVLSVARANKKAIWGVMADVTLDNKTSQLCISRFGGMWDQMTGEPLDESLVDEMFPGRPPWHFNCRTLLVPLIRGAAMPDLENPDAWLKTADAAEALGPSRIDLFKRGIITRSQLVDQSGRPLTLEDLVA